MHIKLLVTLTALIVANATADELKNYKSEEITCYNTICIDKKTLVPITGILSLSSSEEILYKKGFKTKRTLFYENGIKKSITLYNRGLKDKNAKEYYSNGLLKNITGYHYDLKSGSSISFDSSGNITKEVVYKNNIKNGVTKIYDKGIVVSKTTYKNGSKDGEMIIYGIKGKKIKKRVFFSNGVATKGSKDDGFGHNIPLSAYQLRKSNGR